LKGLFRPGNPELIMIMLVASAVVLELFSTTPA